MNGKTKIAVIGVPSSAGAHRTGQEKSPARLRHAGLFERLRANNPDVIDFGDLPVTAFQPDLQNPREQNLDLVCAVATSVAARVEMALSGRAVPLVIGGDCTITIGVLSALANHYDDLGLMYFDGDLDLNIPAVSPSGIFDGMGLSHITGKGSARLAHMGSRFPLVPEDRLAVFAYNPEAGWIDPYELEALERSSMIRFSAAEVQKDPVGTSHEALRQLQKTAGHFLVHFDVDAIDAEEFPPADVPHPHGLSFADSISALRTFTTNPQCIGLVVTEFNSDLDPSGCYARKLLEGIEYVFEPERESELPSGL